MVRACADVKGYSRLMGQDELTTIETLKKYQGAMATLIQQYRGRVVDSPGDNVLAEFGMADLALVHFLEFYYRWSDSAEQSLKEMLRTAEMAVRADDHDPWALTVLAWAYAFARRSDEALLPVKRAIEQSPNFAPAIGCRGLVLSLIGEADQAIDCFRKAVRLSPRDSFMVFWYMGLYWAHFVEGRYGEAVKIAQQAISIAPNNPTFRRQLASAYAMLDRMADAREAVKEYLRLEPNHIIADASKVPTKIPEHVERFVEGLRRAGLPD